MVKFILLAMLLPSIAFAEEPKFTCVFSSGEIGKLKFAGTTREEAYERTVKACLQQRTAQYLVLRNQVATVERRILFLEDCVNKTFCKH